MKILVALCVSFCSLTVLAQPGNDLSTKTLKRAAELRDQALKANESYAIVESLTTEVGPRLAGTPGDKAAVLWAVAKLRELGFDKVWTEPVSFPYWVRGEASAQVVSPFPQPLMITALGHSIGTAPEGLEAEIVEVESYEALQKADRSKIQGKIVFINHRMYKDKSGISYGKTVPGRSRGASAAAKLGAVGLLIRSVGTDSHRFPHTGVMRYEGGVPKIPAAALSNPDADLIKNMLNRKRPVKVNLHMSCRTIGTATSANVIGEITGSETPDEIVLLGAHLDSWDLGTGALDDGAGVAIVTAAAKLIRDQKKRPKRSIRVVLFANEESGLYGGKAYADRNADILHKHVLGAESDFGAGKIWAFLVRINPQARPVAEAIHQVLEPLGIEFSEQIANGGPDLIPLTAKGLPVVTLYQDGSDYFDFHHTADDTLDKVDPESLNQNVAAYVVLAYLAAETGVSFGPVPSDNEAARGSR